MKKTKTNKNKPSPQQSDRRRWIFPLACLALLLISTAWWAYWGAKVQQGNADQLVNAQLFENAKVFKESVVPGTHSFLIKWPVFLLIHLLGQTEAAYIAATVGLSLLTVAGFAWFLYKLGPKPTRLGLLYLALASCLLLVPAAPYSGGLLPVNMAMVANRNIEYLIYLAVLWLVARSASWKSKRLVLAVVLFSALTVSDRLFLYFAILSSGGALLAGLLFKLRDLLGAALRLMGVSALSTIVGIVVVGIVNKLHIANIATGGVSPYGLVNSLHQILLNTYFSFTGLFTNFGANPAFDAQTIAKTPTLFVGRMLSIYGLVFVINAAILLVCLFVVCRILLNVIRKKYTDGLSHEMVFVLLLVVSAVGAAGIFIGSNHYAMVDARYITIALFALFSAMAIMSGSFRISLWRLRLASSGLFLSVLLGFIGAKATAVPQQHALLPIQGRNETISAAIEQLPNYRLVGDYWRVVPIKNTRPATAIVPMGDCTNPSPVLTSKEWTSNFDAQPFIYLLSQDKSLTNFPKCDKTVLENRFGKPSRTLVVSGAANQPVEELLLYDNGINRSLGLGNITESAANTNTSPLAGLTCKTGKTILQVIAHQDDDLLFMNPDVQTNLDQGDCIRTVYLTAGDSGQEKFYWLGREQGSKAAYDAMLKNTAGWIEKPLFIKPGTQVSVAGIENSSRVSLIFFKLPDGNLEGQGFHYGNSSSLHKLYTGRITSISTVDRLGSFTKDELVSALADIIESVKPDVIRTQSTENAESIHDHSDHKTTGRFVVLANELVRTRNSGQSYAPIVDFYQGYPIRNLPSNVVGEQLDRKISVFETYGAFDDAVCRPSSSNCWKRSNYSQYISRQYKAAQ